MSHLKERKEKNCLNCNADLQGRYCHVCGQENLEPKETVWHLVQHFFNDVTHFDGKFFETVRYLLRRPGFLSTEYMLGRRMKYLNPIRMYVFTSAIFFIILYSLKKPEELIHFNDKDKSTMSLPELKKTLAQQEVNLAKDKDEDEREDYELSIKKSKAEIAMIQKSYGDSTLRRFSRDELNELAIFALTDSLKETGLNDKQRAAIRRTINDINDPNQGMELFGLNDKNYHSVEEYDSAEHSLPDSLRDGWFTSKIRKQVIATQEEYRDDPRLYKEHLVENVLHSFPKMLFWSLPIFALILNVLYFRQKKNYYYVDHGIFTIHVYCATFILLLLTIFISKLSDWIHLHWVKTISILLAFGVVAYMLIYLYKAMRGFYKQGRAKTFLKYCITFVAAGIVNVILMCIFLIISILSA